MFYSFFFRNLYLFLPFVIPSFLLFRLFFENRNPYFAITNTSGERVFRRVHSEPLETLQEGGVFGVMVKGLFWFILFRFFWGLRKKTHWKEEDWILFGVSASFIGYSLHGLFSLAPRTFGVKLSLWTMIAFVCSSYDWGKFEKRCKQFLSFKSQDLLGRSGVALFSVILIACLFYVVPEFSLCGRLLHNRILGVINTFWCEVACVLDGFYPIPG